MYICGVNITSILMEKMMKNKANVMASKHYADGYAPFYYKVSCSYMDDYLFDCSDCFRFYLIDDAVEFAIDQIGLLNVQFRKVHAPFHIVVYKDGFKRPRKVFCYENKMD